MPRVSHPPITHPHHHCTTHVFIVSVDASKFKAEFEKCQKLFSSGGSTKEEGDSLAEDLEKLTVEGSKEDNSEAEEKPNEDSRDPPPSETTKPDSGDKKPPSEPKSEETATAAS